MHLYFVIETDALNTVIYKCAEAVVNEVSIDCDYFFNINKHMLEGMCPELDVLLMEHDNIKAGEYDNFYQRWSTTSYINCAAIGIAGKVWGELPSADNLEDGDVITVGSTRYIVLRLHSTGHISQVGQATQRACYAFPENNVAF